MVNITEYFRIFILGDPINIKNDMGIIDIFLYNLFNNSLFICLIICTIILILINLLILVAGKSKNRGNFYIYLAGCFLIFSSLNYKYSYKVLYDEKSNSIKNIYNKNIISNLISNYKNNFIKANFLKNYDHQKNNDFKKKKYHENKILNEEINDIDGADAKNKIKNNDIDKIKNKDIDKIKNNDIEKIKNNDIDEIKNKLKNMKINDQNNIFDENIDTNGNFIKNKNDEINEKNDILDRNINTNEDLKTKNIKINKNNIIKNVNITEDKDENIDLDDEDDDKDDDEEEDNNVKNEDIKINENDVKNIKINENDFKNKNIADDVKNIKLNENDVKNKISIKENFIKNKESKNLKLFQEPESILDFDETENNIYMRKIIKHLDEEKKENKKLKEFISSIKDTKEKIFCELKNFDEAFKFFFCESMKIENEMLSFNVVVKKLNIIAKNMEKDIKNSVNIVETLDYLIPNSIENKINILYSSPISKSKEEYKKTKLKHEINTSMTFLTIYFLLHACLCLYFIISILCEMHVRFLLRILTFLSLTLDIIFGIYMMLYAHVLDKSCMLGTADGCKSTFTSGFSEFAATAGLNLKKVNNNQKERMINDINSIQDKTENVVDSLNQYILNSPIHNFQIKKNHFDNIIDKIDFVKDDFENLTNNKVNKKKFYSYIKIIKYSLTNIELNLNYNVSNKDILELYNREISFLTFLKNEKETLYNQIDKQILRSKVISKIDEENNCTKKKKNTCKTKKTADYISISLFTGGFIFLILVSL